MLLQAEPFYILTQIYLSGFGSFLATVTGSNVFSVEMAFDQWAVKTRLRDHTSSHLFWKGISQSQEHIRSGCDTHKMA